MTVDEALAFADSHDWVDTHEVQDVLAAEVRRLREIFGRAEALAADWSDELGDAAPWEFADNLFAVLGLPERGHPYERKS